MSVHSSHGHVVWVALFVREILRPLESARGSIDVRYLALIRQRHEGVVIVVRVLLDSQGYHLLALELLFEGLVGLKFDESPALPVVDIQGYVEIAHHRKFHGFFDKSFLAFQVCAAAGVGVHHELVAGHLAFTHEN